MPTEHDYWNQMYANACDQFAPSFRYKPRLFVDGNKWCALYGEDLQSGVAGFGSSPEKAYWNFDLNWCADLQTPDTEQQNQGAKK